MITKELIKEILGLKSVNSRTIRLNGDVITRYPVLIVWANDEPEPLRINIYEFVNMCKEWARTKDKMLSTIYYKDSVIVYVNFKHTIDLSNNANDKNALLSYEGLVRSDTEFKAIFKTCDYIFKNLI